MAGRQIPDETWQKEAMDHFHEAGPMSVDVVRHFMEEAGLVPSTGQKTLCFACVTEGNAIPPESIVFIKGTSLCIDHSKNMLD